MSENSGEVGTGSPRAAGRRPWALFATQDLLLVGYLATVTGLLVCAEPGAIQARGIRHTLACALAMALACVFSRGARRVAPAIRRTVYWAVFGGVLLAHYLSLRDILPVIRSDSVDLALYELDLALFGVEPALWLERWNTRPIVEWFSCFYLGYFLICGFYMLFGAFVRRPGRHTAECAIGTAFVFCVGQLGYMAVPGYGPGVVLKHMYSGPVDGGFFWECVSRSVQGASAMKDIFPSLHTAVPLWFALWALDGARVDRRLLPLAVVTLFCSANIVVSTMLLRWHYAVDVLAGMALAAVAFVVAVKAARREERLRARLGEPQAWSFH